MMFYFYSKVFLPTLWQFTDAQMKIKNTVKLCHLASKISNGILYQVEYL